MNEMINFATGNKNMNKEKRMVCRIGEFHHASYVSRFRLICVALPPHMCHVSASSMAHYRLICGAFPSHMRRDLYTRQSVILIADELAEVLG